jgi:hypothetical protein
VCRKPLGRSRSAVGTPPPRGQERVCTGHGSAGSAGKCLAWPVFFFVWKPLILPTPLCFARAGDVQRRGPLWQSYSYDNDTTQHAHEYKKSQAQRRREVRRLVRKRAVRRKAPAKRATGGAISNYTAPLYKTHVTVLVQLLYLSKTIFLEIYHFAASINANAAPLQSK